MSWRAVSPGTELVKGRRYRFGFTVSVPLEVQKLIYYSLINAQKFISKHATVRWLLGEVSIEAVEVGAPTGLVTGRVDNFPFRITFLKIGGGTPLIAVAAAFGAILFAAAIFVKMTHTFFEELIPEVFNPGLIVAGLLGVYFVTKARG